MNDSDLLSLFESVDGLIAHAKFLEKSFTKAKKDGIYSSDIVDLEDLIVKLRNKMIPRGCSAGLVDSTM